MHVGPKSIISYMYACPVAKTFRSNTMNVYQLFSGNYFYEQLGLKMIPVLRKADCEDQMQQKFHYLISTIQLR